MPVIAGRHRSRCGPTAFKTLQPSPLPERQEPWRFSPNCPPTVTAAKQGRPVFNQALKLLRSSKAQGIILHKLDRGARDLRDWAAISAGVAGELKSHGYLGGGGCRPRIR